MAPPRIIPHVPVKLGAVDRKIISLLQRHGRLSLSQMAESVGLSIPSISYRLERLSQEGVLQGFHAHIQVLPTFQYGFFRFRSPMGMQGKIYQFLENHPQTITLFHLSGEYDVAACLIFLPGEGGRLIEELRSEAGFESYEWNEVSLFLPEELDYTKSSSSYTPTGWSRIMGSTKVRPVSSAVILSPKDYTLLGELAHDSRMPLLTLSKKTGMSIPTIKARIEYLIREGVILKFFASINPYTLDRLFVGCLWAKILNPSDESTLLKIIRHRRIGNGTARLNGQWTHAFFLHFGSMEEWFSFESEVREIRSLVNYSFQPIQSQSKLDWIPPYVINNSKKKP